MSRIQGKKRKTRKGYRNKGNMIEKKRSGLM